MINKWLFTKIDNSALLIFRVFFGFLIAAEAIGAIFTGWVRRTLIEPQFTFNFIGFEFLQPLSGNGMYFYFAIMGSLGLLVMIGFKYRWSMLGYTLMWAGVYFMQKSSYNNHYYLLFLLCVIMTILPANSNFSIDAKLNPHFKKNWMPRWTVLVIIIQLWIVYTYASVAKMYPDWLDYSVPKNLMAARANYPIIGTFLQQHWVHICIAWFGILFDLLIIPALLWRRTRLAAFCISIFFHLFNSIVFQIGIFPYLSLAFTVFFFSRERIHSIFLKKKPYYNDNEMVTPNYKPILIGVASVWFIIQIALPLRHWFIPGDVLWTEEGHRLSWRMMLRGRSGMTHFYIVDKANPKLREKVDKSRYLTPKQIRSVSAKPDFMWQFAQRLKQIHAEQNKEIEIYVDSKVSVNGKKRKILIDPNTDLASVSWNHFSTNPWVIKYKD